MSPAGAGTRARRPFTREGRATERANPDGGRREARSRKWVWRGTAVLVVCAGAHLVRAAILPSSSACTPSVQETACATKYRDADCTVEIVPKPAGTLCSDGNLCTYGDRCNGAGSCVGTAITCTSDACATWACSATTGSCSITSYAGPTTQCNDGKPCTTGDHCDGAGTCVSGPIVARGTSCPTPTACGQVCDGVSPYCQPAE